MSADPRFREAIELIDRANAGDPVRIVVHGEERQKELAHSELMTRWVRRLRPDAGDELLIAARAHHIRRWEIPRSSYPAGRKAYLQWRTALHRFHAEATGEILVKVGYEQDFIERVQRIVSKHNLRRDAEVQALEDALCLVFLETQLSELRNEHGDEKVLEILVKTLKKMSDRAKELALELEMPQEDRGLLKGAVGDS
ncbi:MAG: DUF4202 domain-containing protein [Chloroflexi bacterium]|nr:DUF4202 domain-containing protein [Chloroflexota bacterium]MCY3936856.1 DUF4202 domain-containing protein [Chloroflexota bacterium]